jgi:LmbE family N-acetylglucosaminyl deacetylase
MKILIVSPHTDDAELGCGGSISKFIEIGNEIYWIVFSSAEDSLPRGLEKDTLKKEFIEVVNSLNINNYKILNYKVRTLSQKRQNILDELVKLKKEIKPDVVICPSLNDFHQDHQIVSNECVRAFKMNSSIICYELPWNHITFNTQLFIKLNKNYIDKKWLMLKKYKSQFIVNKSYFNKEYVYGLAKVRGVQSNSTYAEAFEVIRWIL